MAKGSMPSDDDLCLLSAGSRPGTMSRTGSTRRSQSSPSGYDPVEYAPKFWNPDRKKPIIHIDFTPAEVDSFYQPVVEVVADVREALELLNDMVKGEKDPSPYLELRRLILEDLEEGAEDQTFSPQRSTSCESSARAMGREDILISDVGTHKLWIARTFPAYEPNTVLISNGLAAMGFALPAAIAAKLVPRSGSGGGERRRRLPHDWPGARDGAPAGARGRERDLPATVGTT